MSPHCLRFSPRQGGPGRDVARPDPVAGGCGTSPVAHDGEPS